MTPEPSDQHRQRVRRGTLTRAQILRVTVALIADDPGKPITMERVARAMGTRPMSLYTHVRNRDDLVDGAVECALADWPVPTDPSDGWEEDIRVWCRSLREFASRYPPLVLEMTRGGRFQPALLHQVARLARTLRTAGLESAALADAVRWIPQTVLGAITLELARPLDLRTATDEGAAIWASLGTLEPDDRDELAALLPHFPTEDGGDHLFEYTVERLLDGIRTQLEGDS